MERATSLYEQAFEQWPEYEELRRTIALLREQIGHPERAAAIWQVLVQERPANPDLWVHLGRCLEAINQVEAAAEAYEQAIGISPRSDHFLRLAARVYARLDQAERAQTYLDRALMETPICKRKCGKIPCCSPCCNRREQDRQAPRGRSRGACYPSAIFSGPIPPASKCPNPYIFCSILEHNASCGLF